MKKLNAEELSRVLTAHALGGLVANGADGIGYPGCLVEVGKAVVSIDDLFRYAGLPYSAMPGLGIDWFDDFYDPSWTEDQFLVELEKAGLA